MQRVGTLITIGHFSQFPEEVEARIKRDFSHVLADIQKFYSGDVNFKIQDVQDGRIFELKIKRIAHNLGQSSVRSSYREVPVRSSNEFTILNPKDDFSENLEEVEGKIIKYPSVPPPMVPPEPISLPVPSAPPLKPSLPDELCCSITSEVFKDPVVAIDGNTYERSAIEEWFKNNDTSPLTNLPLESKRLVPNNNLKRFIQDHFA